MEDQNLSRHKSPRYPYTGSIRICYNEMYLAWMLLLHGKSPRLERRVYLKLNHLDGGL